MREKLPWYVRFSNYMHTRLNATICLNLIWMVIFIYVLAFIIANATAGTYSVILEYSWNDWIFLGTAIGGSVIIMSLWIVCSILCFFTDIATYKWKKHDNKEK